VHDDFSSTIDFIVQLIKDAKPAPKKFADDERPLKTILLK
jgi:hypothetical protein